MRHRRNRVPCGGVCRTVAPRLGCLAPVTSKCKKELKNLSTTTFPTPVQTFIEEAEERGVIDESALEALVLEHDLDEDEVTALRGELDSREGDVFVPETHEAHVAPAPTDSLTLFMNAAGRYRLLTAADQIAHAKRMERGHKAAKELMISSTLGLAVAIARPYRGGALPLGDLIQEGVIGLNRAVEKFDW